MAKNYIKGSFREYTFNDGGSKLVLSIRVEDLAKIANEKGYASVVVQAKQEPDQYGNTHSMWQNDYEPKAKQVDKKSVEKAKVELKKPKFKQEEDGLPF